MMQPSFTRMKPDADNLVAQVNGVTKQVEMLCVECGWEGVTTEKDESPWVKFFAHPCRLVTQSVSTSD